jgi:hypothetical protein
MRRISTLPILGLLTLAPGLASALVVPTDSRSRVADHVRVEPRLWPSRELMPVEEASRSLLGPGVDAWSDFLRDDGGIWSAIVDARSGLVEIAEGSGIAWIPGRGNDLTVADLGAYLAGAPNVDVETLEHLARAFVEQRPQLFGVETRRLVLDREASMPVADHVWFLQFHVLTDDGVPIEGARVFFRVNNGNLIQFGAERVPPADLEPAPAAIGPAAAEAALAAALEPVTGDFWLLDDPRLSVLPTSAGEPDQAFDLAEGYVLTPVWTIVFRHGGESETWQARIDARDGSLLELRDINRYAQVTGGYWPVSWKVGGTVVNQTLTGWPFTAVNPLGATSSTSGLYTWDGNPQTAYHTGPYVNIVDSCGAAGTAASDGSGNITFGVFNPPNTSTPGDCTNQLGISGNTPAARQQYWHVNKIKEKARSYFPSNTWLQQQLTVNVNINMTCNAFWNGSTLNFYRTNGACYNLGANAGVSMHEWGHGMDSNDGNGSSVDNGTGETYGDFSGALQTLNSCLGNGIFTSGVCGGYGNPCVPGGCDGVRDIDWGRHTADVPMTVASFTQPTCPSDGGGGYVGPCGLGAPQPNDKEGHCESLVSSGALWDLAAADLQSGCTGRNAAFPDYNCPGAGGPYNQAGAWSTVDRLWYLSRPTANQAFTCNRTNPTWTSNGCNAGSNWKAMRAVDDDDGNLANGTPHSCQLAAAFDRHGIACTTDPAWNVCFRGCAQPATPTLNPATPGNNQITLSWSPNPSPDVIDVFRNEVGCNAGFAKLANDVSGTLFVDNGVANGTTYYYQIVRQPIGNESCGSAPSTCVSATPALAPSAKYVPDSATLLSVPTDNDADGFVDNCESGRIQVGIANDGSGALTNVRFTVTSTNPAIVVTTAMPVGVGNLAVSAQTTGTFDFALDGAACAATVDFDIAVTANEMTGSNLDFFTHGPVEQDLNPTASRTDSFETGNDGWTFPSGYTRENVTAANGTWSVHSSNGQLDRNDVALSPVFRRGAGASSVVIAERHDIEAPFWDRANVHAIRLSDGVHTLLTPTGRTYTAGGPWNAVGHVGTEAGWAGTNLTWGDATFSLAGLLLGESYRLEINYNTDGAVTGTGHWFDHVRWTNVSFQECDVQSDLCTPCTPPNAPTGLVATAQAANQINLSWNAVVPAPVNYRIYRATTMGGPYTQVGSVGGGTLVYDDPGLTPGVTYYYVVRAFDICESADSNEDSAIAFGDCTTAPTFAGLQSVTAFPSSACGVRLTWGDGVNSCGPEPVVYNVYRSTTAGFTPSDANLYAACVPTTSFDDTAVVAGTTYYYVVRAEDDEATGPGRCRGGNEDNNGVIDNVVVGGLGTVVLFEDDFDGNQSPGNFWIGGNFGNPYSTGACASQTFVNSWYIPESGFCSGNTAGSNDGAANPNTPTYVNGALVLGLPPAGPDPGGILVPAGATSVTLTFSHDYDFEFSSGTNWDGGRLMLATTWPTFTAIAPVGGYPGTVLNSTSFCHPFPGQPAYVNDSGGCVSATFDLTAYSGQRIWLAWNHGADDFFTGDDGWMIDDVRLEAQAPASCTSLADEVQFLTATSTSGQNVIEWLAPAVGPASQVMLRFRTDSFPTSASDGSPVGVGAFATAPGAHGSTTHSGLTNGTTYYYAAFVDDGAGNYSGRRTVAARPFDTVAGPARWGYSTGATALAPPGIGSVYGLSNDRAIHSMQTPVGPSTGQWPATWSPFLMNAPAQSRPPVVPISLGGAAKVAFVSSQDGRVYALDADSGAQLWVSPVLGDMVQGGVAAEYTQFGADYDLILVGTRNSSTGNSFYGLNLADGTVAWSFDNGGGANAIGLIGGTANVDWATNRVYFASRSRVGGSANTVWCLSFTDSGASLVWARQLGDVDGTLLLDSGRVYVGTNNGLVHALDAATGASLWAAPFATNDGPVKGYVWRRPSTNQLLFSTTTTVWSLTDAGATASLAWSLGTIPNPSTPLVSPLSPWAWVGGSDGRLYQLSLSGGLPTPTSTQLEPGAVTVGSPALSIAEGRAYVGTDTGRIYAVDVPF